MKQGFKVTYKFTYTLDIAAAAYPEGATVADVMEMEYEQAEYVFLGAIENGDVVKEIVVQRIEIPEEGEEP
jgi:hypothetical protein